MFELNGNTITVYDDHGESAEFTLEQEKQLRDLYISKKKNMHEVAGIMGIPYEEFLLAKRALGITRKSSPLSVKELRDLERDDSSDDEILEASIEKHFRNLERDFYKKKDRLTESTLKRLLADRSYEQEIAEKIASREYTILDENGFERVDKGKGGTLVIPLADWHYGMYIDTVVNSMNPKTMKKYILKAINKSLALIERYEPEEVVILNLGDMIHGIIHGSTRFESTLDVVDQTGDAAELLATFINTIDGFYGGKVIYGDVWGNHGRVTPDKTQHRTGENFERLVSKFVKQMTKVEYTNVEITEHVKTVNTLNGRITYTHSGGRNFKNVIKDLGNLTEVKPDLILTGHYHRDTARIEGKNIKLIVCPSLCGADGYAQELNFMGRPTQTYLLLKDGNIEEQIFLNL